MGYCDDDSMVRVDFFRESGKWYCTEAVKWTGLYRSPSLINDEFRKSLRDHFKDGARLNDMIAVCLEPYHEHSFPLMVKVADIWKNQPVYERLS